MYKILKRTIRLVFLIAVITAGNVIADDISRSCNTQRETDVAHKISSNYFVTKPYLKAGETPGLLTFLGVGQKLFCVKTESEDGCATEDWLSSAEFAAYHAGGRQVTCSHYYRKKRNSNGIKSTDEGFVFYTKI